MRRKGGESSDRDRILQTTDEDLDEFLEEMDEDEEEGRGGCAARVAGAAVFAALCLILLNL